MVIQYLNSSPPPSFPKARSSRVRNNNEKTSRTVCYFNYTHTHTTIVYTVHQLEDLAGHVVIATGCKKKISLSISLSANCCCCLDLPDRPNWPAAVPDVMTHIINSERFLFSPLLIFWIFLWSFLLENISKKKEKKTLRAFSRWDARTGPRRASVQRGPSVEAFHCGGSRQHLCYCVHTIRKRG